MLMTGSHLAKCLGLTPQRIIQLRLEKKFLRVNAVNYIIWSKR